MMLTQSLSLSGPIEVQTLVSQGCRPIGRPFVITKAKDNVIAELGGKPAMQGLSEVVNQLSPADQMLLQLPLVQLPPSVLMALCLSGQLHDALCGSFGSTTQGAP